MRYEGGKDMDIACLKCSNDLPWRRRAKVVRAQVTGEGRLDEDDVDRKTRNGSHQFRRL